MKYKVFIFLALICLYGGRISAFDLHRPNIHCADDTVKINRLISELKSENGPMNERIVAAARKLTGAAEDNYYYTDSIATLRLNVESFTPLMFVNTVIALAEASGKPGYSDWRNFATELENIALRKGEDSGFPSIMYHTSDWIIDNVSRGHVKELTEDYMGAVVARTKSLDHMTRNRKNFAALADSATFEAVRMNEMGFRTHRIPTLKKESIKKKEILDDLQDGDILILVPGGEGSDCYDMGFVTMKGNQPYFIHLSPISKTVVEESESLLRYMPLMTKYFQGYRLIRVKE